MQPAAVLNVLVSAHTGRASTELRKFDRTVKNTGDHSERATRNIDRMTPAFNRLGGSAGNASRSIGKLAPGLSLATRIPVYKFGAIASAIQAIVPPVVALTSALAPLTGLLGALPGLASAAGQGIGAIALGFKGIGAAVKAAVAGQKTAVKDATSSLQANRAAAEGVRTAIQGVGDAERGLADAQRQSKDAQDALSTARKDAARQLVDMRLEVAGTALSEKEARLELTKAIQAQAAVWADETSTALDARDAELAVQRARLGLKESTVASKRAQTDYNDAQKKGVKGSDQVVSAQRGIRDAHRGVLDAQRALVDATRQVRIAQRDQAESSSKAAGGVEKLNEAMSQLPPSGRAFAKFIIGLKPRLDALRESAASGIFPGLTKGIRAAMGNFGVVQTAIHKTAVALGDLGEQAGKKLGSAEWGRDLRVQGERNVTTISRLGTATLSLADGFRHIMLAAGPLVSFLTKSAERFSAVFASWAKGARESGKLDAFFQKTIATTKITVKAFWDFGRALINIGKIADRVWGQDLLKGIGDVAQKFRDWTESVRGQRTIEQYFVRWRRRWNDISEAVKEVIGDYNQLRREGKSAATAFTTVFADQLAKLIPALANNLGQQVPAIVSGFVRGFLNANAWGKLAIGGWLIAKFGGLAAFAAIGRRLGAVLGIGVAEGAAEGVAGAAAGGAGAGAAAGGVLGALRGKLLPLAKKAGLAGVGIALADNVLSEFSRHAAEKGPDAFEALKAKTGPKTGVSKPIGDFIAGAGKITGLFGKPNFFLKDSEVAARKLLPALQDIADKSKAISPDRARELNHQIARIPGLSKDARAGLLGIVDAAADRGNKVGKITNEFSRLHSGAVLSIKDLLKETRSNFNLIVSTMGEKSKKGQQYIHTNFALAVQNIMDFKRRGVISATRAGELIAQVMKTQTGKGKDALAQNMLLAQNAIGRVMSKSGTITQRGLDKIRLLMVNAMKGLGLSPDSIRMSLNLKESARKGKTFPEQRGGAISHGMVVTGGKPAGDSVHALLERGEVVINRKAVQKMGGPHAVNRINQEIPRFQTGGPVGFRRGGSPLVSPLGGSGEPNFGGHPSNVAPGVAKLIGVMQSKWPGLGVTSTTDHSTLTTSGNVSDHSTGHAVDLASADYGYMNKAARWVRTSGLYRQISQGIHNPNLAVADGKIQRPPGQYAGHTWTEHLNHIHLAIQTALDTTSIGSGKGVGRFAAAAGAVMAPKLAELMVKGGGGMGAVVQGGLGKVRAAAQHKLNRLAKTAVGAGGGGAAPLSGSGPVEATFAKVARKFSTSPVATLALGEAGYAESGMRDLSYGDSSSQGALQLLASTAAGLGVSPHDEKAIASLFLTRGFYHQGANASAAQGLPAHLAAQEAQGSAFSSGSNYLAQEGRARAWMKRYHLQRGGIVGLQKGGAVGYVGDSLGQGTAPKLRGLIGKHDLQADNVQGRSSASGVSSLHSMLGRKFGQYVFDLGTNDQTAGQTRTSLGQFSKKAKGRPLHFLTVKSPFDAESKNRMLHGFSGDDSHLVDWASVAGKYGASDSQPHPSAAGYARRAQMLAGSIRGHWDNAQKSKDKHPKVDLKPFKGSLGHVLNKTLRTLRSNGSAKVRGKRLKQFVNRVRDVDGALPKGLVSQMGLLSAAVDISGTNADNASSLNLDNEDGTTTLGVFQGKDEGGWLNEHLGYLLSWRNKILEAIAIVQKRRDALQKLLEKARKRMELLKGQIKAAMKFRAKQLGQLKELRKKPKENKDKIADLRKVIMRNESWLGGLSREEKGLETLVPLMKARVGVLGGENGLGAFQTNLETIQGPNGPLGRIDGIPQMGLLGGDVLTTQVRLRDLATDATKGASDSPVSDSDSVELLKQLLREANLRTTVSQRQYDVLKNFDATSGAPFLGAFAKGGVALVGERGPELAHLPSGTRVHSASDTEQMLAPNIAVHINGDIVNTPRGKDPIEVLLNDRRFKAAIGNSRLGGRAPLPGRGGGGF